MVSVGPGALAGRSSLTMKDFFVLLKITGGLPLEKSIVQCEPLATANASSREQKDFEQGRFPRRHAAASLKRQIRGTVRDLYASFPRRHAAASLKHR